MAEAFYKDQPSLRRAALAPERAHADAPPGSAAGGLARTYNRIGGLLEIFAAETGIDAKAALAVWQVESGGSEFERGRPVLRFENHKFWTFWGRDHAELFDRHFQFGGRNGAEGASWQNHRFRPSSGEAWRRFHGDQAAEYQVFELAASLAGAEAACLSASFGGPQVMGFNHARLGYPDARSLFTAFCDCERWHVCGFFDFCRSGGLLESIRSGDWLAFAAGYNGPGNAAAYAELLAKALAAARDLDRLPRGVPAAAGESDQAV